MNYYQLQILSLLTVNQTSTMRIRGQAMSRTITIIVAGIHQIVVQITMMMQMRYLIKKTNRLAQENLVDMVQNL